jgi:hypothetical protein
LIIGQAVNAGGVLPTRGHNSLKYMLANTCQSNPSSRTPEGKLRMISFGDK